MSPYFLDRGIHAGSFFALRQQQILQTHERKEVGKAESEYYEIKPHQKGREWCIRTAREFADDDLQDLGRNGTLFKTEMDNEMLKI